LRCGDLGLDPVLVEHELVDGCAQSGSRAVGVGAVLAGSLGLGSDGLDSVVEGFNLSDNYRGIHFSVSGFRLRRAQSSRVSGFSSASVGFAAGVVGFAHDDHGVTIDGACAVAKVEADLRLTSSHLRSVGVGSAETEATAKRASAAGL
jgi:hypothetical protein